MIIFYRYQYRIEVRFFSTVPVSLWALVFKHFLLHFKTDVHVNMIACNGPSCPTSSAAATEARLDGTSSRDAIIVGFAIISTTNEQFVGEAHYRYLLI